MAALTGFTPAVRGCSGFGKKVIEKQGFFLGMVLLRRRLAKCAWHAEQHRQCPPLRRNLALRGQGGFADCDCNGCDAPNCDMPDCDMPKCKGCDMPDVCGGRAISSVCDALGGASCGGGGKGESRRQSRMKERRDAKAGSQD